MSKYKLKHLMCHFGLCLQPWPLNKDQLDIPWQGWTYMTYPNAATLATSCVSVVVGTADRGHVRGKGRHICPYGSPYIDVNWFPFSSVTLQSVRQLVKPLFLSADDLSTLQIKQKRSGVIANVIGGAWQVITSQVHPIVISPHG